MSSAVDREVAGPAPERAGLTVRLDVLLWLGLIAGAAALRFVRLDALPLTFDESERALDALRVSQGSVPERWDGDLSAALTSHLFRIFGDGEYAARALSAAAGTAMVAAVWLWGRALGGAGALAAAALLALSPLALVVSRTAVPYAAGGLLAVVMTASLVSYLREPRASAAFLFAVAFGLAPATDAVATTAAVAVLAFLVVDPLLSRGGAVAESWRVFRRSPSHWLSVGFVLAAALQLGLTHFGTSLERLELTGLAQWREMFEMPRDGRPPEYALAVLGAYELPALMAGTLAFGVFAALLRRGAGRLTVARRLLIVWTVAGALVIALASRREAAQLLVLVLPLALLAGSLVDEVVAGRGLAPARRRWEAAALALFAAASLAFFAHSDLGLTGDDEAAQFAVDVRTTDRVPEFREALEGIVAGRTGPVLVHPLLARPLAWYLRDDAVFFREPTADAAAIVMPEGRDVFGFTPVGDPWPVGVGWYPTDLDASPLWQWWLYREPYGNPHSFERVGAQILVPTP